MMMPVDVNVGYYYACVYIHMYIQHLFLKRIFEVNLVSKMIVYFKLVDFNLILSIHSGVASRNREISVVCFVCCENSRLQN